MPYDIAKDDRCPAGKPWGLRKTDGNELLGCHVSKADAESQMRAIGMNTHESGGRMRTKIQEKAIAVHHVATDTGSWTEAENVGRIPNDASAATLREEYAWQDPEADSATKAAYKFAHHFVGEDGKVGAASTVACSNRIGVLNGGRGGTTIPEADRQGVYDHLAAHLRDADLEPPELKSTSEALRTRHQEAELRLDEAGRVLSAANEAKLRAALDSIQSVLDALEGEGEKPTTEAKRLSEGFSFSAWDASDGAYILAGLIQLMGSECDEPDQLALLQQAYDAVSKWVALEVTEIGQEPDAGMDMGMEGRRVPAQGTLPLREGQPITGEIVPITEAAVGADGAGKLKIIAPGWGSSGYYPAAMLERDGPTIFAAGTKTFWDHPTASEEAERPERSLRDLAGELTGDAYWDPAGPAGPGLYAPTQVFNGYREAVDELAPYIGVSIRAWGKASEGTAEGRTGLIVEQLTAAESVDYVTTPGAGGQVLSLFEAARRRPVPAEEADGMELEEARRKLAETEQKVTAAEQRAARAEEALLRQVAAEKITAHLDEAKIPGATQRRIVASLRDNPPVDDKGALDEAALKARVDEAVKAEADYLASLGIGEVRGFGAGTAADEPADGKVLEAAFARLGLSESGAKIAAAGRV